MACGAMRPLVTLCPSLMPLLPSLKAVGNTLAVSAFDESAPHEAHLQWYLVQALETPPPQPFKWSIGFMAAAPTVPYLGLRDQAHTPTPPSPPYPPPSPPLPPPTPPPTLGALAWAHPLVG